MTDIRAIVFDVDGTMAETSEARRVAFNIAFSECGLPFNWSPRDYRLLLTMGGEGRELDCFFGDPSTAKLCKSHGGSKRNAICRIQANCFESMLETGLVPLRPGVARLIAEAQAAKIPIAVVTTGSKQTYETLLGNRFGYEIVHRLSVAVSGEQLEHRTPLAAYAKALDTLGCAPENTVVFDDSSHGVGAAAALGMPVVALPSAYTQSHDFSDAQLVLSDLGHPAAPFQIIRGPAVGTGLVTLECLPPWLAAAKERAVELAA